MLKHTKKIKEMYEDIQRRIFYMIPEKWEKLYLYASVMDRIDGHKTGNFSFTIFQKEFLRKTP
ncbi:MAG: immunity protein YezG family protein [Clostridia bacterium]